MTVKFWKSLLMQMMQQECWASKYAVGATFICSCAFSHLHLGKSLGAVLNFLQAQRKQASGPYRNGAGSTSRQHRSASCMLLLPSCIYQQLGIAKCMSCLKVPFPMAKQQGISMSVSLHGYHGNCKHHLHALKSSRCLKSSCKSCSCCPASKSLLA